MARQVVRTVVGAFFQALVAEAVHLLAQDGFAQAARATVHQQEQVATVETEGFHRGFVVELIELLQLGEVIAAADGTQRMLVATGRQAEACDALAPVIVQRTIEVAEALFQLVQVQFGGGDIGAPQRHAAADVVAHQRRIQAAGGEERRADRVAATGVQVRHAGDPLHARQPGGGFKLLDRFTFDPGVVRSDQRDAVGQILDAIAHCPIP